jgi:hypothetical protein
LDIGGVRFFRGEVVGRLGHRSHQVGEVFGDLSAGLHGDVDLVDGRQQTIERGLARVTQRWLFSHDFSLSEWG